jgi:DNA-directed RNA polymerase specialized sigma24 family protein
LISHDINQLKSRETGYGPDETITSNCHIQTAFPPNRLDTAEHLSKQLQATEEEVLELGHLVRSTKVSVGDRFRARIILARLEGKAETEVAKVLGCSLGAVCKWSKRFDGYGIAGLRDTPGRRRKARLSDGKNLFDR